MRLSNSIRAQLAFQLEGRPVRTAAELVAEECPGARRLEVPEFCGAV
ncbi:MAG: hypothetical protein QNK37_29480 [Acidobacteriota bacterium]|nr:hypothetical protein [Acidobacteriota bacterium]